MENFEVRISKISSDPIKDNGQNKVSEVITSKGSVYRYLPDGRTQRMKTATGELNEPQDTLTFIPPWDLIKEQGKNYIRISLNILKIKFNMFNYFWNTRN